MSTYANQKHITINRINPNVEKKQYLSIITENLAQAGRTLSEVPFKLYIYLASNQDGYQFDLSTQHFANIYDVSLSSAKAAVNKLIEAGYLVPSGKATNGYAFFEVPQKHSELKIDVKEERHMMPQMDGTFLAMTYNEVYTELKDTKAPDWIKEFWNKYEVAKEEN